MANNVVMTLDNITSNIANNISSSLKVLTLY
jgi:hypothetical protein